MFNNPFLKKDPLLEAVKTAQADGATRRAAVAMVNEEFGVYSRNAVVRENLAAYDARIEETYKALKEGNKENKEKKKEHEEKTGMEHIKKMGGFPGQSPKRTARELAKEGWEGSKEDKDEDAKLAKKHGMTMKQWEKSAADKKHDAKEKKMDEAKKLADKDYDRDRKIESPKDEVWGSRFRAAKAAGKMEEEQIDELYGKGSLPHIAAYHTKKSAESKGQMEKTRSGNTKLPVPKKVTDKVYAKDSAAKYHAHQAKRAKGMMEEGAVDAGSMEGSKSVTKSAPKEDPSLPKEYPGAASSAPTAARLSNAKAAVTPIKEDEQLDEISKTLAGRYINRSSRSAGKHMEIANSLHDSGKFPKRAAKNYRIASNREDGIATAVRKLTGKAKVAANEEAMNEAAYSAKAARAGKDIGKPGKNFEKIAKKAGERYGSEERGKKVAGAILAKIRAKHMKEDQSF